MNKFIFGFVTGFVAGAVAVVNFALNEADKKQPGAKKMVLNSMKKTAKDIFYGGTHSN